MDKLQYLEGIRGTGSIMVVLSNFVVGFYPALHFGNSEQLHNSFEVAVYKMPYLFVESKSIKWT